jgi:hypothetical protein
VIDTVPSAGDGQMNRPRSSRLAYSDMPIPSCQRILIRSHTSRHSAYRSEVVVVAYPWHPLHGQRVRVYRQQGRSGREILYIEVRPGLSREIPAWMCDNASCAAITSGTAQIAVAGLIELRAVLGRRSAGLPADRSSTSSTARAPRERARPSVVVEWNWPHCNRYVTSPQTASDNNAIRLLPLWLMGNSDCRRAGSPAVVYRPCEPENVRLRASVRISPVDALTHSRASGRVVGTALLTQCYPTVTFCYLTVLRDSSSGCRTSAPVSRSGDILKVLRHVAELASDVRSTRDTSCQARG